MVISDIRSLFNRLNEYYWETVQERHDLAGLTGFENDNRLNSLLHFLDYAYERQGSPRIYRDKAKEVIENNAELLFAKNSRKIQTRYKESLEKAGYTKLNLKNNPITESAHGSVSVLDFFSRIDGRSIAEWAQHTAIETAHNDLTAIKGIGPKIASFYLRDIYLLSEKSVEVADECKYFLQPIDVWTRRAAEVYAEIVPEMQLSKYKDYRHNAETIIAIEAKYGLKTGEANIAFWTLGASICLTEEVFEKALHAVFGTDGAGVFQGFLDKDIVQQSAKIDLEKTMLALMH